ncbi:TPA: nucleotidyl transferase AbiEii/AbiGii toxin family protein [Streptococcus pneumoniae]|nr:nucleotidyl transferase AbiEii/AbiGii toxin family protein [Streptococcus pneumoniae]HEV2019896.1 nucleotidyl transferase AbiEii/AbiGii toxin family protein [Streptococcus pneumoniae]HEV2077195.1 nucleotidyl transferase AbiEii/AbiGii toxin family protein [Streptococcus pneumoniae]HEV2265925.1 nucleotidyl transferase AbiEii/AbiGii toxin family protein [Streptococcus pneumoniae]HEV2311802.1 nucleotidyl transferase AbiEii/AbiGii toxin family protein [Streptococcus pneumoniae]
MFSNANSFKAKIKNISKDKGIPAQQVQQHYLIEQVLKLISTSSYRDSFIVKGGYLIGQMIELDKRTTMDLDVTLKGTEMSRENLIDIFEEILCSKTDGFSFSVDKLEPIRQDDEYGGFSLKLNATFDTLKEVVFIDITTGDKITPREITYSMTSIFTNESIKIWTYNLETVLAEKLETIISRGLASTRPRDRYDLFTLYKLRKEEINLEVLKNALENTAEKRKSKETIYNWEEQVRGIEISDYQKELWIRYQRQFKYAKDISFDNSVQVIREIMQQIF